MTLLTDARAYPYPSGDEPLGDGYAMMAELAQAVDADVDRLSASGVAATQNLLGKLRRGASDANLLIVGDSTGNDPVEWPHRLAVMLAADWPTHTVEYRLYDEPTRAYAAAESIASGTGPRKLTVWNASVAGWNCDAPLGGRFQGAVVDTAADLVVVSMGHNESTAGGALTNGLARGRYLMLVESIAQALPFADLVVMLQNEHRDDDTMAGRADLYSTIAAQRGFGIIDAHRIFVEAGKPADWYVDNIHPNATGQTAWADAVHRHFQLDPRAVPLPRQAPSLNLAGRQLLSNPLFASWGGAMPDGWTSSGATITKVTTAGGYETAGQAIRVQSAGAAAAFIQQLLPPAVQAAAKGQWVTLAVRYKVPPAAAGSATASRIGLSVSGGTSVTGSGISTLGEDGWRWSVVCGYVSPAATSISVFVWADSGATGTGDITVDRVSLAFGTLPRDAALL